MITLTLYKRNHRGVNKTDFLKDTKDFCSDINQSHSQHLNLAFIKATFFTLSSVRKENESLRFLGFFALDLGPILHH